MTWYLIRRIGQAIAVVIGVMIMTFIMIHLEPGSAARAALGIKATPLRIAAFNDTYGLNQPLWQQFFTYSEHLLHGNFGTSYTYQEPVGTLIWQALPKDVLLLGPSTILALAIALPMGIYQAVRRNGIGDYLGSAVSFTLYSMPDFFFGILLIVVFAIQFHLFPSEAPQAPTFGGMLAEPRALVLPVMTLTLITVAGYSRYMRSSAIDTLAQDYIKVARAKGLPERLVLSRHLLRNSLLPVVTILGLSLPDIVGGAVIAEVVFNYPGLGLLFVKAATSHDFPILMGTTLLVGVATVIGNLLADIGYGILDPRIRHAGT